MHQGHQGHPSHQGHPGHPLKSTPLSSAILQRALAALTYRDFRVLWLGAFTSTVGTWMQKVAQSWLVFELTQSSFYLGLDDFLGQLPILLFTLIGGVIADRHDRRRLLIGSQYVQMTTAFTLAALVYWDRVTVWHILALSFTAGLAQAFGGPAYQSLIPSLVNKKDLPNAIALNSIQFNLARVFGPLFAGVTMAALGAAGCFSLNGLSFLVVIVALMSLTVKHIPSGDRKPMMQELKGGFAYARSEPAIIGLTVLAFMTTFLGLPLLTFLPVFAREIFRGEIGLYSEMMAYSGMGAVVGALVIAWLGRFRHMGLTLLGVQVVFGMLITAFAFSRVFWVSNLLLFASGAALICVFSLTASLVQLIVPDHLRGRVVSIYMVAFRGGAPLGSLASGYVASLVTAPVVLAVNGAFVSLVAIYFLFKSHGVREL
ncbi:MAG TPA: MFS transporter [Vicinamibacterales bacterium]|nr:MFS transporter [Vicinamibacterales bacterium]